MATPKQKTEFWLQAPGTKRYICSHMEHDTWTIEVYNDGAGFIGTGQSEDYWKIAWSVIRKIKNHEAERELRKLENDGA